MHSVRSFDNDDPHFLDPIVRIVEFEDEGAIVTVSSLLRVAWQRLPPEGEFKEESLGEFIAEYSRRAVRQLTDEERNVDTKDLDTPWRLRIKTMWRHVFADTARWLNDASGTVGSLQDSDPEFLVLPSSFGGDSVSAVKTELFEHNKLIIPTFLAPNVVVRITRVREATNEDESTEKDIITFGPKQDTTLLYLRHGFKYNFHVESDASQEMTLFDTPAAVLVLATMRVDDYASYRIEELQERDNKGIFEGAVSANHGQVDRGDIASSMGPV